MAVWTLLLAAVHTLLINAPTTSLEPQNVRFHQREASNDQGLPCRNGFFLVQDRTLLRFDQDAAGYAPVATLSVQLNALAYADGTLHAVADDGRRTRIVHVDPEGKVTDRGPAPASLEGAFAAAADGSRWLVLTGDHLGTDLVTVDVADLEILSRVRLSQPIDAGDWALHEGQLYAVAAGEPPQLVRVDPATGAASVVARLAGLPGDSAYGAVAVSPGGTLLALHNGTGRIYHIPLAHPERSRYADAQLPAYHADAAACPAGSDFGDGPQETDGPRHAITGLGVLCLGATADDEPGPSGDDADDGLTAPVAIDAEATALTLTVAVRNTTGRPALLAGWHDLDGDGRYAEADLATATVTPGTQTAVLSWPKLHVSRTARSPGLRLRLYGAPPSAPHPGGPAVGGEVEDYVFTVRWPRPAPAPVLAPSPNPSPSAAPSVSPVTRHPVAVPKRPARPPVRTPLTWSVFLGLIVPAITLAARVRR